MRTAIIVNSALASFFMLLALSAYLLVAGNLNPRMADVIQIGQRLPHLTLRDHEGKLRELPGDHMRHLMIICGNGRPMDAAEESSLREIAGLTAQQVPLQAIAIMNGHPAPTLSGIIDIESLHDAHMQLWALTGMSPERPSVAIVDPAGVLRFRTELPASEQGIDERSWMGQMTLPVLARVRTVSVSETGERR